MGDFKVPAVHFHGCTVYIIYIYGLLHPNWWLERHQQSGQRFLGYGWKGAIDEAGNSQISEA